jgi:hypothetical protein
MRADASRREIVQVVAKEVLVAAIIAIMVWHWQYGTVGRGSELSAARLFLPLVRVAVQSGSVTCSARATTICSTCAH